MTARSDIPGRLIYTCNCGWVDKGHANSASTRPHIGAQSLWSEIRSKSGARTKWPFEGYLVEYRQDMMKFGVGASYGGKYLVAQNLSLMEMESVALGIFLEVSFGFEDMQSWTFAGNSSFSEEDIVSDLLGFYAVVRPDLDVMKVCVPVSEAASLAVWDASGGLGKSRSVTPVFHACEECKDTPAYPPQLQQITPARKGKAGGNLWRDWQGKGF